MTWIKICGTTNLEDAQLALEAGADALGFVFYEKSPRYIDPESAREIVKVLPAEVETIGVFVGPLNDACIGVFNNARLTAMQLHPNFEDQPSSQSKAYGMGCFWQTPQIYCSFPAAIMLASNEHGQRFNSRSAMFQASTEEGDFRGLFRAIFLDSSTPEQPGGTGKTFDWKKAAPVVKRLQDRVNVVVAGGLTPTNVGDAIRILKPWGVDVASGVETRPGKKDPEKVQAFIQAVRAAEKNN